MKLLHQISFIVLVIGGLNWGIFALTGWEVGQLFGGMDAGISKLIYILVGLAALYQVAYDHRQYCKLCGKQQIGAAQ